MCKVEVLLGSSEWQVKHIHIRWHRSGVVNISLDCVNANPGGKLFAKPSVSVWKLQNK